MAVTTAAREEDEFRRIAGDLKDSVRHMVRGYLLAHIRYN